MTTNLEQKTEVGAVNLERELDYAYSLIVKRFGIVIEFEKPKIHTGDKHLHNAYFREDGIYLPNTADDNKHLRIAAFLQTLPYPLISQLNPSLSKRPLDHLPQKKGFAQERQYVLQTFIGNAATYMGIEASKVSGIPELVEKAQKLEQEFQSFYRRITDETRSDIALYSHLYKVDPPDARQYLLARWRKGYDDELQEVGFHFVCTVNRGIDASIREYHGNPHDKENMLRLIQNPPKDFVEILWPGAYLKRVNDNA